MKKRNKNNTKNILKNNTKLIIGILIGILLSAGTVYGATILYASDQVSYNNTSSGLTSTNVQDALDELFQYRDVYKLTLTANKGSFSGTSTKYASTGGVHTYTFSKNFSSKCATNLSCSPTIISSTSGATLTLGPINADTSCTIDGPSWTFNHTTKTSTARWWYNGFMCCGSITSYNEAEGLAYLSGTWQYIGTSQHTFDGTVSCQYDHYYNYSNNSASGACGGWKSQWVNPTTFTGSSWFDVPGIEHNLSVTC